MSDFLTALFGADGCSAEGTISSNPFSRAMNLVLDSTGLNQEMFDSGSLETGQLYDNDNSLVWRPNDISMDTPEAFQSYSNMMASYNNFMLANYSLSNGFRNEEGLKNSISDYSNRSENIVHQESDQLEQDIMDTLGNELVDSINKNLSVTWNNVLSNEPPVSDMYDFALNNPYLCNSNSGRLDYFEKGMELYRAGNVAQAMQAFEAQVQSDECHSESWRMLGVCHAERDLDRKALVCYRRSLNANPFNLDTMLAMGISYVNEMDSKNALEALKNWVSHNPSFIGLDIRNSIQVDITANNTNISDIYGDMSSQSGSNLMDEVKSLMFLALQKAPHDPDVLIVLGILHNVTQDYDTAVQYFQKVLKYRPNDFSLFNKIGATLANNAKSSESINYYAKALEMRPGYARGWLNLGISFASLKSFEDAAKAYLQALHLNNEATHIWNYLRPIFIGMNRQDLIKMSYNRDIVNLAKALNVDLISFDSISSGSS